MITALRRMFWMALLGGAGFAAWSWWQRQHAPAASTAPEWPPLDPPSTDTPSTDTPSTDPSTDRQLGAFASLPGREPDASSAGVDGSPWVEPVDGQCPDGYPIKANDNSRIYHVPGGRFYDRTVPERCYARADDAAADGYRAAKA